MMFSRCVCRSGFVREEIKGKCIPISSCKFVSSEVFSYNYNNAVMTDDPVVRHGGYHTTQKFPSDPDVDHEIFVNSDEFYSSLEDFYNSVEIKTLYLEE